MGDKVGLPVATNGHNIDVLKQHLEHLFPQQQVALEDRGTVQAEIGNQPLDLLSLWQRRMILCPGSSRCVVSHQVNGSGVDLLDGADLRASIRLEGQSSSVHGVHLPASTRGKCKNTMEDLSYLRSCNWESFLKSTIKLILF